MSNLVKKENLTRQVTIIHDNLFGLAVTQQFDGLLQGMCDIDPLKGRELEVKKYLLSEIEFANFGGELKEKSTSHNAVDVERHVFVILQAEQPELISDVGYHIKGSNSWLHIVYIKDDVLFLGPHFKDGESGCYDCFRRRRLTHMSGGGSVSGEKFIDKYLESNPHYVVPGYAPMFPSLAAQRLVSALFFPDKYLRTASHISGLNHAIKSCCVIALHGCKCRGKTVDASRYYKNFERSWQVNSNAKCDRK